MIAIRTLHSVEEFEACVVLQREVWGFADSDLVPRRMFVVADSIGGEVLGAFDGDRLIGYTMAMPGRKPALFGGRRHNFVYLHSHMAAVHNDYRDTGMGRALKLRQRDNALAANIELIEWTFDPLEIKNAYFNLVRLGVVVRRYSPNHYGRSTSALQGTLPTDRLTAEWWLRSPRAVQAAAYGSATEAAAAPIGGQVERRVEVTAEIYAWKEAGDARAEAVQARNRDAFLSAFADGLVVIGYERLPRAGGGGSDGAYLLGHWEPPAHAPEFEDGAGETLP